MAARGRADADGGARGSGGRSGCSRTARRPGSCPRTRCSSRRSATSSGSISTRPSARSCSASTRSPRSRRWIAPRRSCRCCPARPSARRTTTSAPAPRASTPRWTSPPARSSAALHSRHRAIEFKQFLQTHRPRGPGRARRPPRARQQLARTRRRRSSAGWPRTRASSCTSRPTSALVAEPRRALVRRTDDQEAPPRRAPLRPRTQRRHPRLDRDLERRPQALRLDQDRRPDPRLHRPLLHSESTNHDTSAAAPGGLQPVDAAIAREVIPLPGPPRCACRAVARTSRCAARRARRAGLTGARRAVAQHLREHDAHLHLGEGGAQAAAHAAAERDPRVGGRRAIQEALGTERVGLGIGLAGGCAPARSPE